MSDGTPQEDAFDRISRVLATPMPRRQAMKLISSTVASATFGFWLKQAQAEPKNNGETAKQLQPIDMPIDMPIHNFSVTNKHTPEVIERLRAEFQFPLSFIQSAASSKTTVLINLNITNGTVKDVLSQLAKQDKNYLWENYDNHIVVYPNEAKYQKVIAPNLAKGMRSEVTGQFVAYVKAHVLGFKDLAGLVIVGDISSPVFTTSTSLPVSGTVLHLFLGLLGSSSSTVFTISPEANGMSTIGLNNVTDFHSASQSSSRSLAAAATSSVCRPLAINYTSYTPDPDCHDASGNPQGPCPTCPSGTCGSVFCSSVASYTACTGDNCDGLRQTEFVTTDSGCSSKPVTQGKGCVATGNNFQCCSDTYSVCVPPDTQPNGCTQVITQQLSMAGYLVQTNVVTYTLFASNGVCKGDTSGNKNTPTHNSAQCCGNNPPASGAGAKTLCSSPQICINGDVCCNPPTTNACNHVCCPTAGATCIASGVCCPSGQATSDNQLCCSSGQTPYGTICCTTGQNNCNGKCCANICCAGVCCSAGQVCTNGLCCGQPSPHTRMSAEAVNRGWYATDNLSVCCPPGNPPCGNICCSSGSICCGGSCCAGTCDNTGVCIPTPGENK